MKNILTKYNDKLELFYVYINFIDGYLNTKDLPKARFYANLCLTKCKDVLDNLMLTLLYNNMGEIELAAKNYEAAIHYFNMTLHTPANYSTVGFRRTNAHIKLAKIYRLIHKNKEALYHAQQARGYLPVNDYHLIKYEVFGELAENYSLQNRTGLDYRMLDTARMHIDSAYSTVSKSTKDFYETKLRLAALSNNMERLKEKERKQRTVYFAIIIGLTALFIFAFIVYKAQELTVSDRQSLRVFLKPAVNVLDEVVVVGYNTARRGSFTGSMSRIVTDYGKNNPVQSFDQLLVGKASGVNISLPNGVLNNAPVIRIRGVNSISLSSYPLIVVNGIPITTGDVSTGAYVGNNALADINPADIESVDVLKDAASTAIYYSRAAAGVIVITTKNCAIALLHFLPLPQTNLANSPEIQSDRNLNN